MTAQHTPGPWSYETDGSTHNDMRHAVLAKSTGLWVAATYRSGTRPENDTSPEADAEAAANARLIAAAPDLLEALQGVLAWGTDENYQHAHAWCEKARAAIQKATHKEGA